MQPNWFQDQRLVQSKAFAGGRRRPYCRPISARDSLLLFPSSFRRPDQNLNHSRQWTTFCISTACMSKIMLVNNWWWLSWWLVWDHRIIFVMLIALRDACHLQHAACLLNTRVREKSPKPENRLTTTFAPKTICVSMYSYKIFGMSFLRFLQIVVSISLGFNNAKSKKIN